MKIDVLCAILDKIDSSPTTPVDVYVDGKDPGYYVITSISKYDERVIINATKIEEVE